MTPQRWSQIKEVFFRARETTEEERGSYLASVCGDDRELRAEVELLLARDNGPSLRRPAGDLLESIASQLVPGEMVAHYRVESKLGEGGMGAVYRAYDTRLRREVALKVLATGHLGDPEGQQRLMREARAACALNHPNIVTVHEIGSEGSVDFIAMEFVEGKSLKEVIPAKGLPLEKVLEYSVQIASGLAKAHAAGIIHRDLKPGNIMVTSDGVVKLLDFGLARRVRRAESETASLTTEAGIAGTPAYMSPEQACGEELDARSDLFSFGVVLYEMATGKQAFSGTTSALVFDAILHQAPVSPVRQNPKCPVELERIINKALEKDRKLRYQSASEIRSDLKRLQRDTDSGRAAAIAGAGSVRPRRGRILHHIARGVGATLALAVLAVGLNVANLRDRLLGRANMPHIESLAVLPVKNFSGDPGQEFFADGMTDALIAGIAQIKAVKVISRTSVMHYKGTSETLPQIAKELDVDGIVEASVIRSGERVRLTAQLIDARHDRHLWANNYERNMTDVLALQSELVQMIAGEIKVQLTPQESERLRTTRRVDPEVYDTTLKAKAVLEYATREEQFREAIELFQKAIDRDPTYAPAWAGLGEALWGLAGTGIEYVAPAEVRDKAIAAADRALELDPNLADAHKARAVIAWDGEWDLEKAQQHFERALELQPSYAAAHNLYSQLLTAPLNRFVEARQHLDKARELDPLSPWNDINLVAWWSYQGQLERALDDGERARQRNPTLWVIPWQMGGAHLFLGQPVQAASKLEAALILLKPQRPLSVLAPLGLAYGLAGRRADALKILTEMEQASRTRYTSPYYLAVVHSGLGHMDQAFRLLDRALEERTPYLQGCTPSDAQAVALRRDPRWKSFIARLRQLVRLPPGTPDPYL